MPYVRTEKHRKQLSDLMMGNKRSFGKKRTPESVEKIRAIRLGMRHTDESKKKMSVSHSGVIPWNKGKRGIQVAWNKGKKTGPQSIEWRTKISEANKGEKGNAWKGGVAPINQVIRRSIEYRLWRTAVFERDNYTCIWCGDRNGNCKSIRLEADHIKPFALFPELRFAIDNGRTLCACCHRKTESYGNGKVRS